MFRFLIAVLIVAEALAKLSFAQDNTSRVVSIPRSISKEAQEFLRKPIPALVPPHTPKQWKELRNSIARDGKVRSKKVIAALTTCVEVKKMGGVNVHIITPKSFDPKHADKALINIHGGGYCLHSPESTYFFSVRLAHATGLRLYCIDYRLAPEHAYPAGLNDCFAAYCSIAQKYSPKKLGVFGISSGGGMALAMILKAQKKGTATPGALAAITPCTDLTMASDSYNTLEGLDPVLSKKVTAVMFKAYLGKANPKYPLISTCYAKYSRSFPPTIIQTGTRDLLLSDCVRLHQKMKEGDVDVVLSVREGMWHGYHVIPNCEFPEAKKGYQELTVFFRRKLKLSPATSR